jgi:hypothetical protein
MPKTIEVKTPMGLFNDVQDIDSVYPWALLPQSIYPPGERSQDQDEGLILSLKQEGTVIGDASGPTMGADIRWTTPLSGLFLGASYLKADLKAPSAVSDGIAAAGQFKYTTEDFYAESEKGRLKLDAELNIEPELGSIWEP